MCRGKTRQGAPDVASHSLGKVEAYLTVREILPETSKGADGVAWCEFNGFNRQQICNVRVNTFGEYSKKPAWAKQLPYFRRPLDEQPTAQHQNHHRLVSVVSSP